MAQSIYSTGASKYVEFSAGHILVNGQVLYIAEPFRVDNAQHLTGAPGSDYGDYYVYLKWNRKPMESYYGKNYEFGVRSTTAGGAVPIEFPDEFFIGKIQKRQDVNGDTVLAASSYNRGKKIIDSRHISDSAIKWTHQSDTPWDESFSTSNQFTNTFVTPSARMDANMTLGLRRKYFYNYTNDVVHRRINLFQMNRDAVNWQSRHGFEIIIRTGYFNGGSYTRTFISDYAYSSGTPVVKVLETAGTQCIIPKVDTEQTISGNYKYREVYIELPQYMRVLVEVIYGGDNVVTNWTQTIGVSEVKWLGTESVLGSDPGYAPVGSEGGGLNAKGYKNHGSTAGTTRPSGFASVEWKGSAIPTNAVEDDTWMNTGGQPVVTSLPGSPVDGQHVYYLADSTNGIVWHFKYRTASSSAYKWEFVGGAHLYQHVQTAESVNSTSTWNDPTTISRVTVPLAGDYDVIGRCVGYANGVASMLWTGLAVGATAPTFDAYQQAPTAVKEGSLAVNGRFTGLSASNEIRMRFGGDAGGGQFATFSRRTLMAAPVRVG